MKLSLKGEITPIGFLSMIIYKITNKLNGKVYIGQTIRTLTERWYGHCNAPTDMAIHNAIKKYGKENFTIEQIDEANDRDELDRKEIYWIKVYDCISPKGYNITKGGVHYEVTEATRNKHKLYCGEKHPMYGKHLSETHKAKLRNAFLGDKNHFYGKTHSKETKEKLRNLNLGKKHSPQTIQKMREANAGEKNGFYGKRHNVESKKKMSDYRKSLVGKCNPKNKRVKCIETNEVFPSIRLAAEALGVGETLISRVCCGKLPHTHKLHFVFI